MNAFNHVAAATAPLFIFPELATSGYAFEDRQTLRALAEGKGGGPGLAALGRLADGAGVRGAGAAAGINVP